MDIQSAKKVIKAAAKVDDSVIMEGLHGIGKSDIMKQFAKDEDYHLETLFLSQQEVGDLIGIPNIQEIDGNALTVWSVPIWLQRMSDAAASGKKCVLFLDELNRAPIDVRQSALQLVLERQIHEHTLPETNGSRTMVVAAINPADADYQTDELDPALLDRFLHITIDVDVPAWLSWASKNKINDIVRDFIVENPTLLHYTPKQGFGSTPRSWAKLAAFVDEVKNIPAELMPQIIKGKIGAENSGLFYSFMKNYIDVVTADDIEDIVEKHKEKMENVEDLGVLIKKAIVKLEAPQKIELAHRLGERDNELTLLAYLYGIDLELCVGYLQSIKKSAREKFVDLAKLDDELNDKALFRRMISANDK